MADEQFDAASIVNQELDKIRDVHGLDYTHAVSAAFMASQAMQSVAMLHAITNGVDEGEIGLTAEDLAERVASFMSAMLGMIAHKLSDEQKDRAMKDVDRIHEVVRATLAPAQGQVH